MEQLEEKKQERNDLAEDPHSRTERKDLKKVRMSYPPSLTTYVHQAGAIFFLYFNTKG